MGGEGRTGGTVTVSPQQLCDWACRAAEDLRAHRGEINDLNVFPIPDSDTGANMAHTMSAAAAAADDVERVGDDAAQTVAVARAMSDAAVGSARGNSGIILSQLLVGLADAADDVAVGGHVAFTDLFSRGLRLASRAAHRAVSNPEKGTVLTLLEECSTTADEHVGSSPADMARAIADRCAEALEETTDQLSALRNAGVVDAGGRGLLVLLDALVAVLTGVQVRRRVYRGALAGGGDPLGHPADAVDDTEEMDYEVMYLLSRVDTPRISELRETLDELGDAVVVVGDSSDVSAERFSVHVHTCEPGKAVEAGLEVGEVADIRISCFALDRTRAGIDPGEPAPAHRRAVFAVVKGAAAAELFESEGASVIRSDEQPLTAERLGAAVADLDAGHTIVMANGALPAQDLLPVAADLRGRQRTAVFLPTLSMAQCLAAMAVHDPDAAPDADAYAMAQAAASTRWGAVVRAAEPALTLAGATQAGDYLGLVGLDAFVVDRDVAVTTAALVDLMLTTGGELVTLLTGADLDDAVARKVVEHIHHTHPGVECHIHRTGQTDELVQVAIE